MIIFKFKKLFANLNLIISIFMISLGQSWMPSWLNLVCRELAPQGKSSNLFSKRFLEKLVKWTSSRSQSWLISFNINLSRHLVHAQINCFLRFNCIVEMLEHISKLHCSDKRIIWRARPKLLLWLWWKHHTRTLHLQLWNTR